MSDSSFIFPINMYMCFGAYVTFLSILSQQRMTLNVSYSVVNGIYIIVIRNRCRENYI